MGQIFCVEFQRFPLKFHTKYLIYSLKDTIFTQSLTLRVIRFKSSQVFLKRPPGYDLKNAICHLVLTATICRSSHDNTLRRMPWHFTDDKPTLVQVMAWCRCDMASQGHNELMVYSLHGTRTEVPEGSTIRSVSNASNSGGINW